MGIHSMVIDKDKDGKVSQEIINQRLNEVQLNGTRSIEIQSVTDTEKQLVIIYKYMGFSVDR
jgi:hypothetical protein